MYISITLRKDGKTLPHDVFVPVCDERASRTTTCCGEEEVSNKKKKSISIDI